LFDPRLVDPGSNLIHVVAYDTRTWDETHVAKETFYSIVSYSFMAKPFGKYSIEICCIY